MSESSSAPLITREMVALDADLGSTKAEVIASLASLVAATGRAEAEGLTRDAMDREGKSATGLPGGFAIPHCRSAAVNTGSLGFARLSNPVDFGAKDGPADLVFLIAAAEGGGADHMKLLTKLARALVKKDFLASLRSAKSEDEIVELVTNVVEPPTSAAGAEAGAAATASAASAAPAATSESAAPAATPASGKRKVIAITACPTGIAHTYMAADSLVQAGEEEGIDVQVETQGSSATTPFSPETIAAADAVIFATDVGVKGRERFAGKPVIESGVKRAINEPKVMLAEAIAAADDPNSRKVGGDASAATTATAGAGGGLSFGSKLKQVLLTGVSYMVPFVAAGGLLIALAFLFGGYNVTDVSADVVLNNSLFNLPDALDGRAPILVYLGSLLHQLGAAAFSFLVPALAGYIAFGIADRPGIVPGFTAGAVAVLVGAGFIGGLIGGLLAGVAAYWIASFNVPRWLRGLMPVVIIPLLATLFAGGLLILFGQPLAAITTGLQDTLSGMSGTSAVMLGVILGLMMCFDLGGPVNKAAYAFASAGLNVDDPATLKIMAAVMAAGMVPPLALSLATVVRKKLFTEAEIENGRAGWLLGASFISEGAIPFAAGDPLRVIPSMMLGGAVTGGLSMALGSTVMAPHGGIFVAFAMGSPLAFVASIVAGMIVAAIAVIALKSMAASKKTAELEQSAAV
ncbi:MAG: fructose-specific PTS transporter subunit EIIC [Dermatophilus congolensis]|nr:fructose-specific PTS transporter subunit EIIC [Dermatophilus congolensis]